ncbi:MAG: hypothetical protein HOP19_00155 [Acidobacteria bacterium]|nr:hypothetical protein [Acidobacteriota bacterium]
MKFWLPLFLCLAHLSFLVMAARQHPFGTYATETDFYHYYAPDAERLAAGQFPANPFQGPGYPAFIALLAKLTGNSQNLFAVGKWLSVFCAVACGWLVYRLFAQVFSQWVGLAAQALAIVSGEFLPFSISATTDVFFLLLCLATLVVLTNDRWHVLTRSLLAGALTGAAYVTRYNGLFLLASGLCGIVLLDLFVLAWRERLRYGVIFLGMFLLAASPWMIANARQHGSPFFNTNYLNIATEFFPELVKGEVNQDATRALAERFHSFGEVLRYDPARLLKKYPANLWESLRNIVKEGLLNRWLAWLALIGAVLVWFDRRARVALMLEIAAIVYLLLMALNHWETRYYFFVMVLCAGLAAYAVMRLVEWIERYGTGSGSDSVHSDARDSEAPGRYRSLYRIGVPLVLLGVLWIAAFRQGNKQLREFLSNHPLEVPATISYLQSTGQCGAGKRIVTRKPHVPYLCRGEWVFFPQVDSIEALRAWLQQNPVDYLLISQRELKERKKLRPLGDPAKAPAWLKPVWSNAEPLAVLYQPNAP